MNLLNIYVEGNLIATEDSPVTTSGSVNYDTCAFNFSSEWEGFDKTAVFAVGDRVCYAVELDENHICKIPRDCLRNAGILKIGVVGKNPEGVVISTNILTHRIVEGANGDEYENPETPGESEENQPIVSNNSVLYQNERFYLPDDFRPSDYSSAEALDIDSYYDVDFNRLALMYPEYVTAESLGTDSQKNPIMCYTFGNDSCDKTILITADHLGSAKTVLKALGGFFERLCTGYAGDGILNYLHNKVKFLVVPVVSPYAVFTSGRYNSSGVMPFFNYDSLWDESPASGKGFEVFSEDEIICIRNLVEKMYDENLIFHLDFESESLDFDSIFYYKANGLTEGNFIKAFADYFDSFCVDSDFSFAVCETNAPIVTNYTHDTLSLNSSTVFLSESDDTQSIKTYAELVGNLCYQAAINCFENKNCVPKPMNKYVSWRSSEDEDTFELTSEMNPMWMSAYYQPTYGVYNVSLNGYVIVEASVDTDITVRPVLFQQNSPAENFDTKSNEGIFDISANVSSGTTVIPFSCVMGSKYSNNSDSLPGETGVVIMAKGENIKIKGFSYNLTFLPSDEKDSIEVLSPTGLVSDYTSAEDTPLMNKLYPKTFYDVI